MKSKRFCCCCCDVNLDLFVPSLLVDEHELKWLILISNKQSQSHFVFANTKNTHLDWPSWPNSITSDICYCCCCC